MKPSMMQVGILGVVTGIAMAVPAVTDSLENEQLKNSSLFVLCVAGALLATGLWGFVIGWRAPHAHLPSSVRAVVTANVIVLAFCALELSDRIVRQNGELFYWSTFLYPPALIMFFGLITARRWAWWTARALAVVAALWFLVFCAMIPFVHLQANGVPTPWYGRVYMVCVSLGFAGVAVLANRALGDATTRQHFGAMAA